MLKLNYIYTVADIIIVTHLIVAFVPADQTLSGYRFCQDNGTWLASSSNGSYHTWSHRKHCNFFKPGLPDINEGSFLVASDVRRFRNVFPPDNHNLFREKKN